MIETPTIPKVLRFAQQAEAWYRDHQGVELPRVQYALFGYVPDHILDSGDFTFASTYITQEVRDEWLRSEDAPNVVYTSDGAQLTREDPEFLRQQTIRMHDVGDSWQVILVHELQHVAFYDRLHIPGWPLSFGLPLATHDFFNEGLSHVVSLDGYVDYGQSHQEERGRLKSKEESKFYQNLSSFFEIFEGEQGPHYKLQGPFICELGYVCLRDEFAGMRLVDVYKKLEGANFESLMLEYLERRRQPSQEAGTSR